MTPRIEAFGEEAFLVVLGGGVDPAVNRRAHRLAAALRDDRAAGGPWATPVPGYESVLVRFDTRASKAAPAQRRLERLVERVDPAPTSPGDPEADQDTDPHPIVELQVRYGGPDGPDLAPVAERLRLSQSALIDLHAGQTYQVFLLGFSPGFAYLGPLPEALRLPRREVPRPRVPAGSVAIAELQTAVYPAATPGGWHLIGRTDARLWDPAQTPPALLAPGGRIRFVPLGRSGR